MARWMGLLLVAACGGDGDGGVDSTAPTAWYTTCGDPVCSSYSGPFDGVEACTSETEGGVCSEDGLQCDPVDDCNALLVCAAEDPKDQTGGCPISRAEHKEQIRYLSAEELQATADRALAMRLATWRYVGEHDDGEAHLGFVIDDVGPSPAVRPGGERVDLYGYTSLTLAAVQAQELRLAAQQAEIDALRADLEALRGSLSPSPPAPEARR